MPPRSSPRFIVAALMSAAALVIVTVLAPQITYSKALLGASRPIVRTRPSRTPQP